MCLLSEFCVVMSVTISATKQKRCSVRPYLRLFVGGLVSYLRFICVCFRIVVPNVCCDFVLFVFVLCNLWYQFLWIVHSRFIMLIIVIFLYNFSKCSRFTYSFYANFFRANNSTSAILNILVSVASLI